MLARRVLFGEPIGLKHFITRRSMEQQQRKYVRDLTTWELPRLDDLEMRLTDEFAAKARAVYFDRGLFAKELHVLFLNRLRELAVTTVNETIEYWLKGLIDGNNGQFPEVSFEFPYLERNDNTEALTVAYCVDNEDGTRTELNRVPLGRALMRYFETDAAPEHMKQRAKVVACELKALAIKLEDALCVTAS
jgi:hypothetical protein